MTNSTFIEGYSLRDLCIMRRILMIREFRMYTAGPPARPLLLRRRNPPHILIRPNLVHRLSPWRRDVHRNRLRHISRQLLNINQATGGQNGTVTSMNFVTPSGTTGTVSLPGVTGKLKNSSSKSAKLVDGKAQGLVGGSWTLVVG